MKTTKTLNTPSPSTDETVSLILQADLRPHPDLTTSNPLPPVKSLYSSVANRGVTVGKCRGSRKLNNEAKVILFHNDSNVVLARWYNEHVTWKVDADFNCHSGTYHTCPLEAFEYFKIRAGLTTSRSVQIKSTAKDRVTKSHCLGKSKLANGEKVILFDTSTGVVLVVNQQGAYVTGKVDTDFGCMDEAHFKCPLRAFESFKLRAGLTQ